MTGGGGTNGIITSTESHTRPLFPASTSLNEPTVAPRVSNGGAAPVIWSMTDGSEDGDNPHLGAHLGASLQQSGGGSPGKRSALGLGLGLEGSSREGSVLMG